MLERAILRAIAQIEKILANEYQAGKAVGGLVGGLGFAAGTHYLKKRLAGGKTQEVRADKVKDIHHSASKGVNDGGHGSPIAAIYLGDDGNYYKLFNDSWLTWDGQNWN
jgi:hypothetical protein